MTVDATRVYAIKPDVVDRVLGSGVYTNWLSVLEEFTVEQERAYANERLYSRDWARSLASQLQADMAFCEQVCDDYASFLERVTANKTTNVTEGENMLSVLVLAISILTYVNDFLEKMFSLGIEAILTSLSTFALQRDAKKMQDAVDKLVKELKKAKSEVKEAWVQGIFDAVITVGLLLSGPLGWVTLGAVGVTQMAADAYLGPSMSSAARKGRFATNRLGNVLSVSDKILENGSKAVRIAKPAGKFVPVIGLAFDANEISVAYKNVDGLKQLIADAKSALDDLIAKINFQKTVIANLILKFEDLHQEIMKRGEGWIAMTRQALDDETRRTGYRPRI